MKEDYHIEKTFIVNSVIKDVVKMIIIMQLMFGENLIAKHY